MQVLCTCFTIWSTCNVLQIVISADIDDLSKVITPDDDDLIDYNKLFGVSPRRDLEFPELTEYDGYPSETYSVTTKDGYILGLYRIPPPKSCTTVQETPIIFMHGLYLSGDDCIILGPGKAHCYVYSDNCYDVWVPNVRGNRYSRKHISLDPDKDPEYWDFAFDEFGLEDLPAIIDHVLATTGKDQVYYVGHSQGVAVLLVLLAKKPEYNNKIKMAFGLSAEAWFEHSRFFGIPIKAVVSMFLDGAHEHTNAGVFGHGQLIQTAGKYICSLGLIEYPLCTIFLFAILGYNKDYLSPETMSVFPGHSPAGTSLKNLLRWGQLKNNGFSERDYGDADNLIIYGQKTPPLFDLSPITAQWYFYASTNDYVADPRDVEKLTLQIPNAKMCTLADKYFGHLDYVYANVLKDRILDKILLTMKTGQLACD